LAYAQIKEWEKTGVQDDIFAASSEEEPFATLDGEELEKLAPYATVRTFDDGDTLFAAGDVNASFFVVKKGAVEIVDFSSGQRRVLTVHGPGQFTGDSGMLAGRPAPVSAMARGTTVVYEISAEALRQLVGELPSLADKLFHAFLARRDRLEAAGLAAVQVLGSRFSRDTLRVRDFLAKNQVPFTWIDVERNKRVAHLFARFHIGAEETPLVTVRGKALLRNPSNRELGEALNLTQPVEKIVYDLAIVGGGPAGLAAAVYGASEGLKTIVLEKDGPGGQASNSSRIENYMGFPAGLSGADLASRAVLQAQKFGATITVPVEATGISSSRGYWRVDVDDGDTVVTRCVLIATGAAYRKLPAENCDEFEGKGIYYSATVVEAQMCTAEPVVVVGAGNSAGQAAVFLSEHARSVLMVFLEKDLRELMSSYLANRIEKTENIACWPHSEIVRVNGKERVQEVVVRDKNSGEEKRVPTAAVFIFIGAEPHTAWLPAAIETDEHGFICTGAAVARARSWSLRRPPYYLETSCPGVFAAGDVRAGSVKRVASAVGEGSMTVHFVHQYLAGG
jgi:thioredoxin reductase (NADPH)